MNFKDLPLQAQLDWHKRQFSKLSAYAEDKSKLLKDLDRHEQTIARLVEEISKLEKLATQVVDEDEFFKKL